MRISCLSPRATKRIPIPRLERKRGALGGLLRTKWKCTLLISREKRLWAHTHTNVVCLKCCNKLLDALWAWSWQTVILAYFFAFNYHSGWTPFASLFFQLIVFCVICFLFGLGNLSEGTLLSSNHFTFGQPILFSWDHSMFL